MLVRLLPYWLTAVTALEYVHVPQTPVEPRWSAQDTRVASRAGNSSTWPYGPFSTQGRDIVNSRGEVITWAGVNWPLSLETMVPEGLEWASAEEILDMVGSVGFNFVRMYVLLFSLPTRLDTDLGNTVSGDTRSRWWIRSTTATAQTCLWR